VVKRPLGGRVVVVTGGAVVVGAPVELVVDEVEGDVVVGIDVVVAAVVEVVVDDGGVPPGGTNSARPTTPGEPELDVDRGTLLIACRSSTLTPRRLATICHVSPAWVVSKAGAIGAASATKTWPARIPRPKAAPSDDTNLLMLRITDAGHGTGRRSPPARPNR
jgi:hypothetical protein